jgi:hypothetical protein
VVRGTLDAPSGYALELKMHKTEQVRDVLRVLFTNREAALYSLTQRIWEIDAQAEPLPAGDLEVEHAEIGPGRDPKEQADLAVALQNAGWSQENTYKEVWNKDEEWIERNRAQREDEKAAGLFPEIPSLDGDGFEADPSFAVEVEV